MYKKNEEKIIHQSVDGYVYIRTQVNSLSNSSFYNKGDKIK